MMPNRGTACSIAILTERPIMPDKKDRKSEAKTHRNIFVCSSPTGTEPMHNPKEVPNMFAYSMSKNVVLKSVMKGICNTNCIKPMYNTFASVLNTT